MSADILATNAPRRTLCSANGKAFTSRVAAHSPADDSERPLGVAIRRAGRRGSIRSWFVASVALLAGVFFLLGVDGAEKQLSSGPAMPSAQLRLF